MKKIAILFTAFVLGLNLNSKALELSDFSIESEFQTEAFASLDAMDQTLEVSNENLDLPSLMTLSGVDQNVEFRSSLGQAAFTLDDMDWGSFAWGFCCCPVGFFVVAINDDKSQDQKLSYWIGLGVNVVLGAISSAVSYSVY